MNEFSYSSVGVKVIEKEIFAVKDALQLLDIKKFDALCEILHRCSGHVITTGVGKSGHIASKVSATLASTGTPSFFIHPTEAGHGDIGMVTDKDVVIAFSHSGESEEIINIIPAIVSKNVILLSITGNKYSTIAKSAKINIDTGVQHEACPLDLAPTSTTTVSLVIGDAIAVALLTAKGYSKDDFAKHHPSGLLGRRLLLKVDNIMHFGDAIPKVFEYTSLSDVLIEMNQKMFGMTTVISKEGSLVGIYTDGDLRRTLDNSGLNIRKTVVSDVMTKTPVVINRGILAVEALKIMENYKITSLVVVDKYNFPVGLVHIHDILNEIKGDKLCD